MDPSCIINIRYNAGLRYTEMLSSMSCLLCICRRRILLTTRKKYPRSLTKESRKLRLKSFQGRSKRKMADRRSESKQRKTSTLRDNKTKVGHETCRNQVSSLTQQHKTWAVMVMIMCNQKSIREVKSTVILNIE